MVLLIVATLTLGNFAVANPAGGAGTAFRPLMVEFAPKEVEVATPIVVTVRSEGAPVVEAELADDGLMPDETARDGVYSGAMWFSGSSAEVSIKAGTQSWSAGTVSVPGEMGPRFLRADFHESALRVAAFSPSDTTPVGPGADTLPPLVSGGGQPGGAPPGEPPQSGGGGSSIRSMIIAVVAGLLGAFGGHALGQRSRP